MSRPSIGDIAMTGAERQARYRTADERHTGHSHPPTGGAGSSAGMTPSPGYRAADGDRRAASAEIEHRDALG
jgi:hypothetical protein